MRTNYFGKSLEIVDKKRVNFGMRDNSVMYYRPSIVDEEQVFLATDGSCYIMSDIALLKGMHANSSPALVEALSARMALRDSTGVTNQSDDAIMAMTKPRHTQDKTEVAAFGSLLMDGLRGDVSAIDYADLVKSADEISSSNVDNANVNVKTD